MVTTAGYTGLLTGLQCVPHRWPIRLFSVLQTGPLAGAQLEVNDVFDVDVSTDKAAREKKKASWERKTPEMVWKWNINRSPHILESLIYFLWMLVICLITLFWLIPANSRASAWIFFVFVSSSGLLSTKHPWDNLISYLCHNCRAYSPYIMQLIQHIPGCSWLGNSSAVGSLFVQL